MSAAYILQAQGAVALATALKSTPLHIAIGRGDPAWDTLTPEQIAATTPSDATGLLDEIGRRVATVQYVTENPAGDIEITDPDTGDSRRYQLSATPTAALYLSARFASDEGAGEYVREIAIYADGQPIAGLPAGQDWFTADQIDQPGAIYALIRTPAKYRDGVERILEETVLPL